MMMIDIDKKPSNLTYYTDNLLAVFSTLYRSDEPMSQYAIAKYIGCSRQIVSNNIRKLIDTGLVKIVDEKYTVNSALKDKIIHNLFKDIIDKLVPIIKFEQVVSGDTEDTVIIMKNIVIIMMMISQIKLDVTI